MANSCNSESKELLTFIKSITETKLFQRLKAIKQLGLCLVFPNVNHSRYDHSIGTYHLAGKQMRCLEVNSNIEIEPLFRQCVQIAALLHDIGHGPWSHFWEQNVNKKVKHEQNCMICIDKIFDESEVIKFARNLEIGKNLKFAIKFIKSLITGEQLNLSEHEKLKDFLFLYEIVNNKYSDIDVDRWDYLKRDFNNAKIYVNYPEFQIETIKLDFEEIFTSAIISDDRAHILYDRTESLKEKVYKFFEARQKLHIQLYTHPTTKLYEYLLARAIKRADKIKETLPKFNGKLMNEINFKEENFNINEIIFLTDQYIFEELKHSKDPEIIRLMHYIVNANNENESKLKNTIKKIENVLDPNYCITIEIKVKSPTEKMSKFNLNIDLPNIKGIHEKHIFNIKELLEYELSN